MGRRSLLNQVLAINALIASAAVLIASVAAQLRLDIGLERRAFLVLVLAILVSLLANAVLLRHRFEPLERVIETMEAVDLAAPGLRAPAGGPANTEEVARLRGAFNRMLDRIEDERRKAGKAVLQAHEAERTRIARDLHDEVNQALTAVLLRLEATAQNASPELEAELRETKRLATQAMEELLTLARELRPTALDDLGLTPALAAQVRNFGDRAGIRSSFRVSGVPRPLSHDEQIVVYRITQESLSNVAQHANAKQVKVELSFTGATVLAIADDGHGMPRGHARDGGLGLSGMRERALQVGGRLAIHSVPGSGTRVELTIEGK